jgi:hypothetical protein
MFSDLNSRGYCVIKSVIPEAAVQAEISNYVHLPQGRNKNYPVKYGRLRSTMREVVEEVLSKVFLEFDYGPAGIIAPFATYANSN